MNKKTFYKVSNEEIYQELLALRKDLQSIKGKIRVVSWVSGTALSLVIGVILGGLIK